MAKGNKRTDKTLSDIFGMEKNFVGGGGIAHAPIRYFTFILLVVGSK